MLNGQSTFYTALPRNKDALQVLQNHVGDERPSLQQEKKNLLDSGQMCMTLWNENGKAMWYLRYCVDVVQSGLYTVKQFIMSEVEVSDKRRYCTSQRRPNI